MYSAVRLINLFSDVLSSVCSQLLVSWRRRDYVE